MLALAQACREGRIRARVGVVVSPLDATPAVEGARRLDIPVAIVPPEEPYGPRLLEALDGCDVVCLAGYLRLLPNEVLRAFPRRVLNIHPALLPKFGGKGMYGRRVHEAVLAAGETESGCTVHLVTERYDEGEILVQKRCPVLPGDTPETLAARVLELEHEAYPEAVAKVVHGLA
jgi:phosphoribosylglycinamide formyltransferase 1